MQLIHRSLALLLTCFVLLWTSASFAADTRIFASELAEHVQGDDQASGDGMDLDSPQFPESPGLTTSFLRWPPVRVLIAPVLVPTFRPSVSHPPTLPPPRGA